MKQSFNTHSSNKSPGPSTTADVQKANDNSKNGSLDRQVAISLKKAAKDVTTTEGRLNIISQIDSTKDVLCCKYSENYDYLAAGYTDGIIRIYNASTGEPTFTLSDADVQNKRAPVTCIQHRPVSKSYPMTNSFIGSYANGCVKCWSYHFNQCLYTIQEKRQTFGVTYHPRFPKFVTYGDDSKLYFYDEETQTQERVLMASEAWDKHDGHMSRIFAACFHPRNNYELITGGWDDVVQFWDLRQPYAVRHISGLHICGEGLDINMRGTEVLTACFQKTDPFQLFDYGSGKRIQAVEPDIYYSKLYCGRYINKDFAVTGGTEPNLFRIVDLQTTTTAACINYLPGAIYSLDVAAAKKKPEKDVDQHRTKSDVSSIPKIAFVSTKKVYQVDFY